MQNVFTRRFEVLVCLIVLDFVLHFPRSRWRCRSYTRLLYDMSFLIKVSKACEHVTDVPAFYYRRFHFLNTFLFPLLFELSIFTLFIISLYLMAVFNFNHNLCAIYGAVNTMDRYIHLQRRYIYTLYLYAAPFGFKYVSNRPMCIWHSFIVKMMHRNIHFSLTFTARRLSNTQCQWAVAQATELCCAGSGAGCRLFPYLLEIA